MAHRPRRRSSAFVPLALLAALLLSSSGVGALSGGGTDPDDVNLPVDIRAVTHADDATTVTYTLETWGPVADDAVDVRWMLDLNGDGKTDLAVAAQWEDDNRSLVATVEDPRERVVGRATLTRPASDTVRVSFPRSLLGAVTAYRYTVIAVTDLDHDGETDGNERDVAPNSGFYEHRLSSGDPPATSPPVAPAGPPTTTAPAAVAPTGTHSPPGAVPSVPPGAGQPAATPAPGTASRSPAPARPTPAVSAANAALAGPDPGPADAPRPSGTLPTSGFAAGGLTGTGAALLLAGVVCRCLGRRRDPTTNPGGSP